MNILEDTNEVLKALGIPIETGVFKSEAPDTYIVLVPLTDTFPLNADDMPQTDLQELRIQRAIRFLSRRRLLKALSSVEINLTERKIILGKQRLPNRRKTLR